MTVTQALAFFSERKICDPLRLLQDVGLGYMTLGSAPQHPLRRRGAAAEAGKRADEKRADLHFR